MKFLKLTAENMMTRYINIATIQSLVFTDEDGVAATGIEIKWTNGDSEEFEGEEAEKILAAIESAC